MNYKMKMKTIKSMLVMLLALTSILVAAGTVTAGPNDIGNITSIEVSGTEVHNRAGQLAVTAGETISVRVWFEANKTVNDVRMESRLEGEKDDVEAKTDLFDVEQGKTYSKTFLMEIPYELQEDPSANVTLDVDIWSDKFRTELQDMVELSVQRPSYNAEVMSIESPQNARAGQVYPVDVVLKNRGYNNLDEVMVDVSIPELGIQRSSYFGDLANVGNVSDEEDTEKGRFFLEIPSDTEAGQYTVEVEASNDETSVSDTKQFTVQNEFSQGTVFVDSLRKTTNSDGNAQYSLTIANPSNHLKAYRVVADSQEDVSVSVSNGVVSVPAQGSRTVQIVATPQSEGDQQFDVNVLSVSGDQVEGSKTLTVAQGDGSSGSSDGSVIALTIILAVIFLVLLGILVVLLRKKPAETEEFGESYY